MDIDTEDRTGRLVSERDIDDAIAAVIGAVPKTVQIMQAGVPGLAVNIPNILRCLQELQVMRRRVDP